jgi:hypothetical protein
VEARSRGVILPGCPKPDNDNLSRPSGGGLQPPSGSPPEGQPDSAAPAAPAMTRDRTKAS